MYVHPKLPIDPSPCPCLLLSPQWLEQCPAHSLLNDLGGVQVERKAGTSRGHLTKSKGVKKFRTNRSHPGDTGFWELLGWYISFGLYSIKIIFNEVPIFKKRWTIYQKCDKVDGSGNTGVPFLSDKNRLELSRGCPFFTKLSCSLKSLPQAQLTF